MPAQSSSCEQAHRRSRPRGAAGCRIREGPDDGFLCRRARRKRQIGAEASMSLPRGHAIERGEIPPFAATYAPPDEAIAARLLAEAPRAADAERRIDARAARLVEAIRARAGGLGGVEDFLREYSLSTKEGLALMVLAEALLRVPDAERYFGAYATAIDAIGAHAADRRSADRPGISVKLSALHPRFEPISRSRALAELGPKLLALARRAKARDLQFTIDAEEADRLELSLELIGLVLADPSLAGWSGFGLAVQAYQKRAPAVIDWVIAAAQALDRRLNVRLVKGAYWDSEIKRAQERGLADYPVFTRKAMTDLCYMDCMRRLIAARPQVFPQFATHNALTVASVIEEAGGVEGYEFQRLHGMGEALYATLPS